MTRDRFDSLIRAKGNEPLIVLSIIKQKGIAFLPTKETLRQLTNVHPDIVAELKKPETYTKNLRVHICHYSAPSFLSVDEAHFADRMFFKLSNRKEPAIVATRWPLLRGIPFDDHVGPINCFDSASPKEPGISYVTIRGELSRSGGHKEAETIFTYLPVAGGTTPLGQAFKKELTDDLPDRIVQEALNRLENMLK